MMAGDQTLSAVDNITATLEEKGGAISGSFEMDALNSLRSVGDTGLLDAIDTLRSEGISHYVSLPQLIVCGDQSSGKRISWGPAFCAPSSTIWHCERVRSKLLGLSGEMLPTIV